MADTALVAKRSNRGSKPGERRGGRKKGTPNKATASVMEAAQQYTDEALLTLAEIMRNEEQPASARVSAASHILDRGHGKPAQALTGAGGGAMELVTRIERIFTDDAAKD